MGKMVIHGGKSVNNLLTGHNTLTKNFRGVYAHLKATWSIVDT